MMRTLRASRHMARVECVTDHVRWRKSSVGSRVEASGGVVAEAYLEGVRSVMGDVDGGGSCRLAILFGGEEEGVWF